MAACARLVCHVTHKYHKWHVSTLCRSPQLTQPVVCRSCLCQSPCRHFLTCCLVCCHKILKNGIEEKKIIEINTKAFSNANKNILSLHSRYDSSLQQLQANILYIHLYMYIYTYTSTLNLLCVYGVCLSRVFDFFVLMSLIKFACFRFCCHSEVYCA